jgi:2-phosphosulfolactate phosphatase
VETSSPFDQGRYQVRFEWGAAGLARLAPAEVVVVVDPLHFPIDIVAAVARDGRHPLDADSDAAAIAAAAASGGALVLAGSLRNATAVARAVADAQHARGERTSVALVGAGDTAADAARFTVEDLLAAGAIVDALAGYGIDHTSPEAAAACEAFRGLRGAVRHLFTASGSGQRLIAVGRRDDVLGAAALDSTALVPVLRDGAFVPLAP